MSFAPRQLKWRQWPPGSLYEGTWYAVVILHKSKLWEAKRLHLWAVALATDDTQKYHGTFPESELFNERQAQQKTQIQEALTALSPLSEALRKEAEGEEGDRHAREVISHARQTIQGLTEAKTAHFLQSNPEAKTFQIVNAAHEGVAWPRDPYDRLRLYIDLIAREGFPFAVEVHSEGARRTRETHFGWYLKAHGEPGQCATVQEWGTEQIKANTDPDASGGLPAAEEPCPATDPAPADFPYPRDRKGGA